MKHIEVTLYEQSERGLYCLGIDTVGHVTLGTFDYGHRLGNAVDVTFFDMTTEELQDLRDKLTDAIGGD